MVVFRNECVDCPIELGCLEGSCPYINVPYLVCDECGFDEDVLYELDGKALCGDCVLQSLTKIQLGDI